MSEKSVLLLLISSIILSALAKELPSFIHVCKRYDPNLNDCVEKSLQDLMPTLRSGDEELGLPPLEPLFIKEIVASETGGIKLSAYNLNVYGAGNFYMRDLQVRLDELYWTGTVVLPLLMVEGEYNIEGKLLSMPIKGSGPMRANFTDWTSSVFMDVELVKHDDGEDHLNLLSLELKFQVGDGEFLLENLFGGEQIIGDVVNQAINSNFEIFCREVKPIVEKSLGDQFLAIANKVVNPYTYEQMFPTK